MMRPIALVLSCEHAVATVPDEYSALFKPFQELLSTHRGIDFGALAIAEHLQTQLACPLFQATSTRLLIDCNRSLRNAHCFSEATRSLPAVEKQKIINQYYTPYRQKITKHITQIIADGFQVWHLSIHSFTPVLNNITRNAEIGFLYNPKRCVEKNLARQWQQALNQATNQYRIRMNYPYSGVSDGLTTSLRRHFTDEQYAGIEVEANQALTRNAQSLAKLKINLAESLFKIKPAHLMLT